MFVCMYVYMYLLSRQGFSVLSLRLSKNSVCRSELSLNLETTCLFQVLGLKARATKPGSQSLLFFLKFTLQVIENHGNSDGLQHPTETDTGLTSDTEGGRTKAAQITPAYRQRTGKVSVREEIPPEV